MKKSKEENKKRLLKRGIESLTKNGYNATGIQELVDAAGVPKGSFYNYFKSKEDFAIEALNRYSNIGLQSLETIANDKSLAPLARIEKLIDARIKNIIDSQYTDFCMVTSLCDEMGDVNPAIGNAIKNIFLDWLKPLQICLKEAQEEGELRKDLDIEDLAEFIDNSWRGTALSVKAIKSSEPLYRFRNLLMEKILR